MKRVRMMGPRMPVLAFALLVFALTLALPSVPAEQAASGRAISLAAHSLTANSFTAHSLPMHAAPINAPSVPSLHKPPIKGFWRFNDRMLSPDSKDSFAPMSAFRLNGNPHRSMSVACLDFASRPSRTPVPRPPRA